MLRSLRYVLNVRDSVLVEIFEMAHYRVSLEEVVSYLKREEDDGFKKCSDTTLGNFLNGMVIYKRGKDESRPVPEVEIPLLYNDVMKKVRIAYQLKDTDVIRLIENSSRLRVSKTELSAFFRARSHPNFRECGAQYLRAFLKGLTP